MFEEDFIDLSMVDNARIVRRLGLLLFFLDMPYFVGDSRIYHFARRYGEHGEI